MTFRATEFNTITHHSHIFTFLHGHSHRLTHSRQLSQNNQSRGGDSFQAISRGETSRGKFASP